MSDRTEQPTERKLEELREQGLVPYSHFSTALVSAALVFLSLFFLKDRWGRFTSDFRLALNSDWWGDMNWLDLLIEHCQVLLLVPTMCALAGILVCGLMQTRLLINFSKLAPTFSRLLASGWPDLSVLGLRLSYALTGLVVFLTIGFVCSALSLRFVLNILNHGRDYLVSWPLDIYTVVLPFLLATLFLCAFAVRVHALHRFMHRHRMSREDILREAQED